MSAALEGIYDPSEQRWVCLACQMEHPPGPCPLEEYEAPADDSDPAAQQRTVPTTPEQP